MNTLSKVQLEQLDELQSISFRFSKAWTDLCEIWDRSHFISELLNNVPDYPFGESFDELTEKVDEWTYLIYTEVMYQKTMDKLRNALDETDLIDSTKVQIAEDFLKEAKECYDI